MKIYIIEPFNRRATSMILSIYINPGYVSYTSYIRLLLELIRLNEDTILSGSRSKTPLRANWKIARRVHEKAVRSFAENARFYKPFCRSQRSARNAPVDVVSRLSSQADGHMTAHFLQTAGRSEAETPVCPFFPSFRGLLSPRIRRCWL